MKKYLCFAMILLAVAAFAQPQKADLGITYQALIFKPNGQELPGKNSSRVALSNTSICLRFSIVDSSEKVEYQETAQITTDKYGMVNLLIGKGKPDGGYAAKFSEIKWDQLGKKLRVELDAKGSCASFEMLSEAAFAAVPYVLDDGLKLKEDLANKQNSLTPDASNAKYPTVTAVIAGLDTKEDKLAAGTADQYYRGDKSWQALNTTAFGDPVAYGNIGSAAGAKQSEINAAINTKIGTIPDDKNLVHINAAETITGEKTFDANVGIGTTAKVNEKLEVAGAVKANNFISPVQTFTGKLYAWDLAKGSNAVWTMEAGANSLSLSNMKAGMFGTIVLVNEGTSTMTFTGGVHKVNLGQKGVPQLTMTPKAADIMLFFYDGTTFWWSVGNNYD